jgi:tetratricopeptide (TPR) repeat protein
MVRLLCGVLLALSAAAGQAQPIPRAYAGHYELLPTLLGGLSAPDDAVRARCAFLIGQIGDRKAAAGIRPLLDDPSLAVRYQAGIALCALGDPAGLPAAAAALASAAEWIRYYAAQAMADLATDSARTALKALRPKQGELIGAQIDEAMEAWPWPSAPPAPAKGKLESAESLHELFIDVTSPLVAESDGYWHLGNYPQCIRCNRAIIFLDPHFVDQYGTTAWLLWSIGQTDRATALLRQGLAANPDDWGMWFDTGDQYMLLKEYAIAARFLRRAVELGATPPQNHQYCHALERSGHPDQALAAWQDIKKRFPDDPLASQHVARLQKLLAGDQPPTHET